MLSVEVATIVMLPMDVGITVMLSVEVAITVRFMFPLYELYIMCERFKSYRVYENNEIT